MIAEDKFSALSDKNGIELENGGQYGINPNYSTNYMLTGNSTILLNNTLSGYTYASAYNGYQYGNATLVANLAITNIFECGRDMAAFWGNGTMIVNYGSVESFLGGL